MLPYVGYKDLGSSSYIGMGSQKKDVVVSAKKRGCATSQNTQEGSMKGLDPKVVSGYKETTGIMHHLGLQSRLLPPLNLQDQGRKLLLNTEETIMLSRRPSFDGERQGKPIGRKLGTKYLEFLYFFPLTYQGSLGLNPTRA